MKKVFNGSIILLLMTPLFAATNPIPCPTLSFVMSHALNVNAVQIVKKNDYAVFTSFSYYESASKLKWQLGTDVNTFDFNSAFDIGSKRIQDTTNQIDIYAEYLVDFWLCLYTDSKNVPVYLVSPIDDKNNVVAIHDFIYRKIDN